MIYSTPILPRRSDIPDIPTRRMQAGRSAFFLPVKKEAVFPLLSGKGLGLPAFCGKAALAGLAGQEKIILAALRYFFPPGLAQKGNPRGRRPIKSGKHIPMGLFIQKSMIMKLQVIGKIGRHAMAIFLITGICLLTSKGIVPTGMITLLLLASNALAIAHLCCCPPESCAGNLF